MCTAERYGWRPELVAFARNHVIDRLPVDPSWLFSDNKRVQEELQTHICNGQNAIETGAIDKAKF